MNKRIAIIGGGMTGLSAAYSLWENKRDNQLPVDIQLFEASDRLGGKIYTTHRDGFTIERGADSFLARKKPATDLIERLGLTEKLVRNATGQAYVYVKNRLHTIPKGSYRGIPTRFFPYMASSMFSRRGKLRGLFDLWKRANDIAGDESLGLLLRKRYGNEYVDHLIEPLIAGIYSGEIDRMSLEATLPELIGIMNSSNSLSKGLRHYLNKQQAHQKQGQAGGAFYSLRGGLQTIVETIHKQLSDHIHMEKRVRHIQKEGDVYFILFNDGTVYEADAICLATEHHAVCEMFPQYSFIQDVLQPVRTTSTANIALAFDNDAFLNKWSGTGFVVSRKSSLNITACTWTHKKWPETTPRGKALLRTYVGKPHDETLINKSDEQLVEIVQKDIYKTMNIQVDPSFYIVTRWPDGRPQYDVGHTQQMTHLKEMFATYLPNVEFAGSSYHGVGIPDCIEDGQKAVQRLIARLNSEKH